MEDTNFVGGIGFMGFQLGCAVFLAEHFYIELNVFAVLTGISADGSIHHVVNCCRIVHQGKKQLNLEC